MANPNVIQGDTYISGNLTAKSITPSDGSVTDAKIAQPAVNGTFVAKEKIEQGIVKSHSQPNTTATSERRLIHIAKGPGLLEEIKICSIVAPVGAATVTFALNKNGSTNMLSGTLKLDNTSVALTPQYGSPIAAFPYATGDVFDLTITAAAGGGTLPTGIFCHMLFKEDPIG